MKRAGSPAGGSALFAPGRQSAPPADKNGSAAGLRALFRELTRQAVLSKAHCLTALQQNGRLRIRRNRRTAKILWQHRTMLYKEKNGEQPTRKQLEALLNLFARQQQIKPSDRVCQRGSDLPMRAGYSLLQFAFASLGKNSRFFVRTCDSSSLRADRLICLFMALL